MSATFETMTEKCGCGVHIGQGVVKDGRAFVAIGVHGATEAEITAWVADHREALKPLLTLSVERIKAAG